MRPRPWHTLHVISSTDLVALFFFFTSRVPEHRQHNGPSSSSTVSGGGAPAEAPAARAPEAAAAAFTGSDELQPGASCALDNRLASRSPSAELDCITIQPGCRRHDRNPLPTATRRLLIFLCCEPRLFGVSDLSQASVHAPPLPPESQRRHHQRATATNHYLARSRPRVSSPPPDHAW